MSTSSAQEGAIELSPTSPTNPVPIPVLVDFLNSVPTPLTAVLVGLAPYFSTIRYAGEIISWKAAWYDSWLAIFAWWAVCVLADVALRYLLPVAVLFVLAVSRWTSHPRFTPPPITEHNLQSTISDLTTIQALLPTLPPIPLKSATTLLRVAAITYIPYLILAHLVGLRIWLGVTGTILLSWRSPWAQTIGRTLWRSAWVRWSCYHAWAKLSAEPLPPPTLSLQPTATSPRSANSIRFLFTIYENQRWWMGLDWTAALLPGERPSWCSAAQQPVSPPNGFALPVETSVILADGKGGRVKRIARWGWEENEWKVNVKKDGVGLTRVEIPLPSTGKEDGPSGSKLLRAATKMREASIAGTSNASADGASEAGEGEGGYEPMDDCVTDPDGWVYADNKWEGQSSKGGMGKYTRYRRWTRVAILSEVVEVLPPGEADPRPKRGTTINVNTPPKATSNNPRPKSPTSSTTMITPLSAITSPISSGVASGYGSSSSGGESGRSGVIVELPSPSEGGAGEEGGGSPTRDVLRQRLKSALSKGAGAGQ